MIKKKTKRKTETKKSKPKKRAPRKSKKEARNPVDVRKDLSKLVSDHAGKMTQAVIGEGEKGQLAPVKFLLELARIFPPSTDENVVSTAEESFAETLLKRLDIPDHPVVADLYENDEIVIVPARKAAEPEAESDPPGESAKGEAVGEETAEIPVGCD